MQITSTKQSPETQYKKKDKTNSTTKKQYQKLKKNDRLTKTTEWAPSEKQEKNWKNRRKTRPKTRPEQTEKNSRKTEPKTEETRKTVPEAGIKKLKCGQTF
jgi:hypothetical protein